MDTDGFKLPTVDGGEYYIKFNTEAMNLMQLIKLFIVILTAVQVYQGLKIVQPILKEYKVAQHTGVGITMSQRRATGMKSHITYVKVVTLFQVLAAFASIPLCKTFMHDLIGQLVDAGYA